MKKEEIFRNPIQIGMVVEDLDATLKYFEEILGIGPFKVVPFPPEDSGDLMMKYHGEDSEFTANFCFCDLGNIEIEVIQPLTGKSIWRDFLDEKGPGLHHIKFSVPRHDEVRKHFAEKNVKISQCGSSVGKNAGKVWEYYDLEKILGFSIETMNEII